MSKLLTVKDITKIFNLSLAATYRLIYSKEINFYKIGNSLRIKEEDLEKYLKEHRTDVMK